MKANLVECKVANSVRNGTAMVLIKLIFMKK